MSGHTPGPWMVACRFLRGYDVAGPVGEDIAHANYSNGADEPECYPALANARLIAAAPDLLTACKELREVCAAIFRVLNLAERDAVLGEFMRELERIGVPDGFGVRAQQVIAKAEDI